MTKSSSPPPKHVITNDNFYPNGRVTESTAKPAVQSGKVDASDPAGSGANRPSAKEIQAGIKAQRRKIAQLEARIGDLQKQMEPWRTSDCTHVLRPDNSNACDVSQKLTAELDRTKGRLDQEKKNLESMQEDARKMGYANSVYDPN